MLRTVAAAIGKTKVSKIYPRMLKPAAFFSSECDKEGKGVNRKLEPHPDAEKEPLERFPNDINPRTGEQGGPRGPEPTRYGDWERKGKCVDF